MQRLLGCLIVMLIALTLITISNAEYHKTGQVIAKIDSQILRALEEGKEKIPVIIVFREKSTPRKTLSALLSFSMNEINIKHRYSIVNAVAATVSRNALERLKYDPNIEAIYYDRPVHAFLTESVPLINATKVWQRSVNGINLTGAGISICIVDTGVDYTHPDLGNCTPTEFLAGDCTKVPYGYDFINNDPDPMDDNGHGTHCAGIAAANGILKGIAPEAKIIAMKALDNSGSGSFSDVFAAVEKCINISSQYNISVISMSLGDGTANTNYCDDSNPDYSFYATYINTAVSKNISVIVATGNNGSSSWISFPACIQNATPVGATDKSDNIASYTNRNENFTEIILAPGGEWGPINDVAPYSEIVSTFSPNVKYNNSLCFIFDPTYGCLDNNLSVTIEASDLYIRCSGTSMATPHVAGVAALLYQFAKISNKSLTPQEIENVLKETGKKIYDSATGLNFSRVDALAALQYINDPPAVNNIFINRTQPNVLECWINITDNESSTGLTVYYEWYKDGVLNSSGSCYPINASTLTMISNITINANGNWSCAVTPYDGIENGTQVSASLIVGPYLANAKVNPPLGNTSTMFNFTIVYYHLDNINHTVNITIDDDATYQMLPANVSDTNVADGKVYYFNTTLPIGVHTYWFFAGNATENYTTPVYSGPIVNDWPNITYINLTPIEPIANSTLNCSFMVIDNVWNQTIIANVSFLNGTQIYNSSLINVANGTLTWINITPPLHKHENWTCSVTVSDGYGYTSFKNVTREIQNTPPLITNLTINNTDKNWSGTLGNLTFNYTCEDLDKDSEVSREIIWTRNGAIFGENLTSISHLNTTKGDIWVVNVRCFDGEDWSDWRFANFTIQNTPPLTAPNITSPESNEILRNDSTHYSVFVNFSSSYDPDAEEGKDTLKYLISINGNVSLQTNVTNASILLKDGYYTLVIIASDGEENISSKPINFTVDVKPLILVNNPKEGENVSSPVTFNITVLDVSEIQNVSLWGNWSGWNRTDVSNETTNGFYIFTKELAEGKYTFAIEACDNNSFCKFTSNISFTVTNSTTPVTTTTVPSGGNGGGGNQQDNQTISKRVFIWSSLSSNKTYQLNITGDFVTKMIEFKVNQSVSNARLNITKISSLGNVSKPGEHVYSYFRIDSNFENFESLKIYFSVNKNWIENNSLDKSTVTLERYENNSWNPLPTLFLNETTATYEYVSNLTHLSLFAITASPLPTTTTTLTSNTTTTTINETTTTTIETNVTDEEESEKGHFSWWPIIIGITAIIIALAIWFFRHHIKILWYYLTS